MRFKQGCKPSPLNPKARQAIISALEKAVAPFTSAPHCVTLCSCVRGQQLSSYAKRPLLAGAFSDVHFCATGMLNKATKPPPGWFSSLNSAPCERAACRTIARPRPMPPLSEFRELSGR